jgi:hypothetical protein
LSDKWHELAPGNASENERIKKKREEESKMKRTYVINKENTEKLERWKDENPDKWNRTL